MNPQLYAPIPQYMRYYNIKQNDEEMEQATETFPIICMHK